MKASIILILLLVGWCYADVKKIPLQKQWLNKNPRNPGFADVRDLHVVPEYQTWDLNREDAFVNTVTNIWDMVYVSNLWLGSQQWKGDFMFDSGSFFSWVNGPNCTTCANGEYSFDGEDASETETTFTGEVDGVKYVKGEIKGDVMETSVRYHTNSGREDDDDYLLSDFRMMSVFTQVDAHPAMDGLIGLGYVQYGSEDSFLEEMYQKNEISSRIFSIYYNTNSYEWELNGAHDNHSVDEDLNGGDSFNHMAFGGWDSSILEKDADGNEVIDWVYVVAETIFWEVKIQSMTYNGIVLTYGTPIVATTDTGTSLMYMTYDTYNAWWDALQEDTKVQRRRNRYSYPCRFQYNGLQACLCSKGARDVYKNLKYEVVNTDGESVWLEVQVEDYVVEVFSENNPTTPEFCYSLISYDEYGTEIMLGDTALRGYYLIHDNDKVDVNGNMVGKLGFGHIAKDGGVGSIASSIGQLAVLFVVMMSILI